MEFSHAENGNLPSLFREYGGKRRACPHTLQYRADRMQLLIVNTQVFYRLVLANGEVEVTKDVNLDCFS